MTIELPVRVKHGQLQGDLHPVPIWKTPKIHRFLRSAEYSWRSNNFPILKIGSFQFSSRSLLRVPLRSKLSNEIFQYGVPGSRNLIGASERPLCSTDCRCINVVANSCSIVCDQVHA